MVTEIRMRAFEDGDYPHVARTFTGIFPDMPFSEDDFRRMDQGRRNLIGITAEDVVTGLPVGFGVIWQDPYMNYPDKYRAWVHTDLEYQHRGVGGRVYDWIVERLLSLEADTVWTNTRDDRPEDVEFIRRRGFEEIWRNEYLRLLVDESDTAALEAVTRDLRDGGITIVSLASEGKRRPDYLRDLHVLYDAIQADVPRAGYFTPVPYEEFVEDFARNKPVLGASFLAKSGDSYIGLSILTSNEGTPTSMEVDLTGVRADYRRRGIAKALKLHTLRFAQDNGYVKIETGNDATNEAMLALNLRVGFEKIYSWVTFEKQLDR